MGNDKSKTKSAMLSELESIKGLLLEDDDIPILQEVIEQQQPAISDELPAAEEKPATRVIVEQQQDFFHSDEELELHDDLLDELDELEEKTAQITPPKSLKDFNRTPAPRPSLAKASGENPFLPEHIRSRLHGNNPPPLFASETAKKIAQSSRPTTQLGSLQSRPSSNFTNNTSNNMQQDIIDSIVARVMPELEKELRQRLESMSKSMLDELNR